MRKPTEKEINDLISAFTTAGKDKKQLALFLQALFTPAELKAVVGRWQIVQKLAEGTTNQRAIAEDLEVGVATVTRGSRELKDPRNIFWKILGKK